MENISRDVAELLTAYRKAKAEAFYENTHFHAFAFAEYEDDLSENLKRLLRALNDPDARWSRDPDFIGGFAYIPKSVKAFDGDNQDVFFRWLDPLREWERRWKLGRKRRTDANFRLVIKATVD